MKKSILLIAIILLSHSCGTEIVDSFDYVIVTVTGTVVVAEYDFDNAKWGDAIEGEAVEMALIKAGGERVEATGTTGGGVGQTTIHGSFNLYKEQPIDFKAKLVSNPMVIGSDRVEWDYVNKNRRYGGKNQPDICSVDLYIPLKIPK
jgi:hypothetical protein